MTESSLRSLVKTGIYRVISMVVIFILAMTFYGELGTSLLLTSAHAVIKTFTHYLYERIWAKIAWGYRK